ncbi:hypothetical protein C8Q76DRAFT_248028 [Earliella scabrosa]|nr:hypothetical protein C8Q76DRAFT_248028 [Earliella scabrosa]
MQTRAVERGQQRPASNEGREESRQAQSALSTGSPSRSGVVGKNNASIRVLLTGRRTGETAATKVTTREQKQAQSDSGSSTTQAIGWRADTARARMSPSNSGVLTVFGSAHGSSLMALCTRTPPLPVKLVLESSKW